MPKILGFLLVLTAALFLFSTLHDVYMHFDRYGVTTTEAVAAIGSVIFGIGFVFAAAYILWGQ